MAAFIVLGRLNVMGIFRGRRFSLTLILLAALLAWWLAHEQETMLFRSQPLLSHEPDYFLEDFILTLAGEDGLPRYRLSGVSLVHYPDTDSAIIERPRIELMMAAGGQWLITAQRAETEQDGNLVRLQGQVSVSRLTDDEFDGLSLKTEALNVYVAEGYAVTDEEVMIRQPQGVTRAQGLRINFQQRHLYLRSRVRGEYALSTD